jgi:drug/metabolite transporter (DMT)-like permease
MEKTQKQSAFLFVGNKVLGGTGSILLNWAISLASVTIINALIALEYTFVFLLGIFFARWFPTIFRENSDFRIIIQKISAIVLISIGVFLVSLK